MHDFWDKGLFLRNRSFWFLYVAQMLGASTNAIGGSSLDTTSLERVSSVRSEASYAVHC